MCSNSRLRYWAPAGLLFVALALLLLVLHGLMPERDAFIAWLDTWLPQGPAGACVYVLLSAGLICLAVPRQLLSFAGGYAFGAALGTLLATIGVTLGCVLAFSLARRFGQGFVERRYGDRLRRFNRLIAKSPFLLAVFLRLFPSGNNLVFSLVAGVSRIPALPFWGGSCVGYVPQNLIFALLGSGLRVDPLWRLGSGGLLFIISCALAWRLCQRFRPLIHEQD